MAPLSIYRLVPIRPAGDPSWELVPYMDEVTVRAESGGEARALASMALEAGDNSDPSARIDASYGSAFGDPNLYAVRRDDSGRFPVSGPKGVCARADTVGAAPRSVADSPAQSLADAVAPGGTSPRSDKGREAIPVTRPDEE